MTEQLLSFKDGVQFAWDSTTISAYEKCPRYYQLTYYEGWRPNFPSVHLVFGGHYATALEKYFKHVADGMTEEEALRAVVRQALIDTWEYEYDEEGNPIPDSGQPWDSMDDKKSRDTLIRSIVWYFSHFEDDPAPTIILPDGKPAVEYSFALPVDNDVVFCGHIDRLVDYQGTYVMDQKTSGATITPRYFQQYTPDIQMSMYTWAGKIIFDTPVKGVIIDAAQIAVGFTRFERGFVPRTQPVLEEWYDNTMATIEDAKKATVNQEFRMNRQSCGNYGGCVYRNICGRIPQHRPNLLAADFHKDKRWDPLERR